MPRCVRAPGMQGASICLAVCRLSSQGPDGGGGVCRRSGWKCVGGGSAAEGRGHSSSFPAHPVRGDSRLASRPQGSGYIREQSGARESGPRAQRRVRRGSARAARSPRVSTRRRSDPPPPCASSAQARTPQHQYGLLHRKLEGPGDRDWSGAGTPGDPLEGKGREGSRCKDQGAVGVPAETR